MSLVQLSKFYGIRAERILGYEIYQKEDTNWFVKWDTEDGVKESEKFPSNIKANEYVKEIAEQLDLEEQKDFWKED